MSAIDLHDGIVTMGFSRDYVMNPDEYEWLFETGLTAEMLERLNGEELYPLTVKIDTRRIYLDEIIDMYPGQTLACYMDVLDEEEVTIEAVEKMAKRIWFNIYPVSSRAVTMIPKEMTLFTLLEQHANTWTGALKTYRFEWDEKDPAYGEMTSSRLVLMKERIYRLSVPSGTF